MGFGRALGRPVSARHAAGAPTAGRHGEQRRAGSPREDDQRTASPSRSARPLWPRLRHQRTRLEEKLPVDHRLSRVYRFGAGLMGLVLFAFGVAGLASGVGFLSSGDTAVGGLTTNGALSVLSMVVGCALFAGMLRGGNTASTLNLLFGVAFLLSGFVNLALLETGFNVLNFGLSNVLFSFVVGLLLMTFGMYGRVGSRLPHDNPYWRMRHPEQAAREERYRRLAARQGRPSAYNPRPVDNGEGGPRPASPPPGASEARPDRPGPAG